MCLDYFKFIFTINKMSKITKKIDDFTAKNPNLTKLLLLLTALGIVYCVWLLFFKKSEGYTQTPGAPNLSDLPTLQPPLIHIESPENYCKCICSGSVGTVKTCINKKQTLINYKNGLNENANFAELQQKIGGPVWKNNTCFGSY